MTTDEETQLMRGFRKEGYTYADIAWLFAVDRAAVRRRLSIRNAGAGFLQPGDVAELLSISPKKVRSLIRSGAIRASNLNDARRPRFVVRGEDLDAFVKSRQVDAAPATRRRPAAGSSFKRYRT